VPGRVGELLLAFGLSSAVGAERQLRGKPAGLRTQSIVGTSAALILLVSEHGFADVLSPGTVVLDPSRVAAQIVSGIGFLGAGLIITRRGAIHGVDHRSSSMGNRRDRARSGWLPVLDYRCWPASSPLFSLRDRAWIHALEPATPRSWPDCGQL
jgi:MgtC family